MSVSGPHRARMVRHIDIACRLAEKPFRWDLVNTYRSKPTAYSIGLKIEMATLQAYSPAGSYESRLAMVDEGWTVEARCVRHAHIVDVPRETADVPRETARAPFYRTQHRLRVLNVLLGADKPMLRAHIAELSDVCPSRTQKILQFLTERWWVTYRQLRDGTGRHVYELTKLGREEAPFLVDTYLLTYVPRETNAKEG